MASWQSGRRAGRQVPADHSACRDKKARRNHQASACGVTSHREDESSNKQNGVGDAIARASMHGPRTRGAEAELGLRAGPKALHPGGAVAASPRVGRSDGAAACPSPLRHVVQMPIPVFRGGLASMALSRLNVWGVRRMGLVPLEVGALSKLPAYDHSPH